MNFLANFGDFFLLVLFKTQKNPLIAGKNKIDKIK